MLLEETPAERRSAGPPPVFLQRCPRPTTRTGAPVPHNAPSAATCADGFRASGNVRLVIELMHARHVAREEIGLEQLRLAARGGTGLERFYSRLGWEVTGRWPGALRFAPGDDRDEILMILAPL